MTHYSLHCSDSDRWFLSSLPEHSSTLPALLLEISHCSGLFFCVVFTGVCLLFTPLIVCKASHLKKMYIVFI